MVHQVQRERDQAMKAEKAIADHAAKQQGERKKMEEDTRQALKHQILFNAEKVKKAKQEEDEYIRSIKPVEERRVPMGDCDECANSVPVNALSQRKTMRKQEGPAGANGQGTSYSQKYAAIRANMNNPNAGNN